MKERSELNTLLSLCFPLQMPCDLSPHMPAASPYRDGLYSQTVSGNKPALLGHLVRTKRKATDVLGVG